MQQKSENEESSDFTITPKPLFLKHLQSPKSLRVTSKLTTENKGSPSDLCRRNPKLYSHKKNVELKTKKLDKTSELFEIKDLDLKPNASLKNLQS